VDAHIHFPRPDLMDDVVDVLDTTGMARANLVATPDRQFGTLKGIGFDGLKFFEGKSMDCKMIPLTFDGSEYAGMRAALWEKHNSIFGTT
jgi:hypothetical protein